MDALQELIKLAEETVPPLKIDFPAPYTFRVVALKGPDTKATLLKLVESVLGPLPENAVEEKPGAKFGTYRITGTLHSEEQRQKVYGLLKAHPDVKLTL